MAQVDDDGPVLPALSGADGPNGALADALAPLTSGSTANFSVAVLDTGSGVTAAHGDGSYATASVVKVGILAALLVGAQDEGRRLTAQERSYATVMIEKSDNDAATALWGTIGGPNGFETALGRLGLTDTHTDDSGRWGLTRTTASDQLTLLRAVFLDGSPLSARSQAYLRTLMGRVIDGQAWGISSAADGTGPGARLKNGWMPRDATGLWVVNSIGEVTANGRPHLIAVLSEGNADQEGGVALVEEVARTAVATTAAYASR
ncbi:MULTISPECIES: serine hydrolase [Streptomyces violaceusniger group]|uniref:Beta-lactamase class A catalytic domain-containing protein n=1 Tax=Streptomyces javensis TaxID=114698 RepID=A0ABN1WQM7_9ACTN|nr:serine hydrolase [Streptomyces javensis]